MEKFRIYLQLIISFAKVGTFVVGGGYSMVPFMQNEIVEYRKWITDDEMLDCMAIGQSLPGVITINTTTLIGYRVAGVAGAICSTIGIVFPAFLIIVIFAAVFKTLQNMEVVQNAMSGIRAAVIGMILFSVQKMLKVSVKEKIQISIFILVFILLLFTKVSPLILIILSGFAGYIYKKKFDLKR